MTQMQRWEPLPDGKYDILAPGRGQATNVKIEWQGKAITINADYAPSLYLSNKYALCQLVPAAEVGVPSEVVEAIEMMALSWRNVYGPVEKYKIVRAWLAQMKGE